jgi:hypothetical protein
MYYMACSKHLAWGYVDHPPMNVFIAWFARDVFGDSPLGLRLLPAMAGAALVWSKTKAADSNPSLSASPPESTI